MARVLGMACSGRKEGFTATLLRTMLEEAKTVKGIKVEMVYLTDYKFGPCIGCFECIRNPKHTCTLNDDFGRKGEGIIFKKVKEANALILASPVHNYGISAIAHIALERLYPFVWSNHLNGIPFVGVTCASCGGGHLWAIKELCRLAYTIGMHWIDGLPVHTCFYDSALTNAKAIGANLAKAAKEDEKGRHRFTDVERMLYYQSLPWSPFMSIMENLKMINQSIKNMAFKRRTAIEFLKKADKEYKEAVRCYSLMKYEESIMHLNAAWSYWTRASWSEYLEREVIGVKIPEKYRPL